jgi:hypothetical protein
MGQMQWPAQDGGRLRTATNRRIRQSRRQDIRETLAMNLEAQSVSVSLVPQLDICHHERHIISKVGGAYSAYWK